MPAKRHAASTASAAPASPTPNTPTPLSKSLSSGPATLKSNASAVEIAQLVWEQYLSSTPQRTLLLDAFMAFLVLVGGLQFLYCALAGNYVSLSPFHSLLTPIFGSGYRISYCINKRAVKLTKHHSNTALQRIPLRLQRCCRPICADG